MARRLPKYLKADIERGFILEQYAEFLGMRTETECRVVYEIWCFLPPNKFVVETVAKAREEGMPVELVDLGQVHERVRQVAFLEPIDQKMIYQNAFLWAASLFREAGAWK